MDLYKVDLSQLIRRDAFTLCCVISNNRLRIKTSILINTRVNRYTFINTNFVKLAIHFLDVQL